MKKALVLGLLVLAFGAAASAQEFVGSWSVDSCIAIADGVIGTIDLTSVLNLDYTIGCVTLGTDLWVDETELAGMQFNASGTLGAFSFWSGLIFDPLEPAFVDWENLVSVSIAGVEFAGAFVIQDLHYFITKPSVPALGTTGVGWALLGHAVCGDVEVWGEFDFNLSSGTLSNWYNYGFYKLYDWDIWQYCDGTLYYGNWSVQTASCCACFSNLDLWAEWPLGCLDMLVKLNFTCAGFTKLCFELNDIDVGAGWFQLDDLDICFEVQTKSVSTDFTLLFGQAACVTPYFDVVQNGLFTIDGIRLRALLFAYTFDGVTVKAGELFYDDYYVGFTTSGSLTTYAECAVTGADEFVGIWYDGDACCGGLISASFAVFFDSNLLTASASTGIFDYILGVANVEVGIGSNFALRVGMNVSDVGLESICLGFTFSW